MYKIGVIGHRNIKKDELKIYKNKVYEFLKKKHIFNSNLLIVSPLADGADRLVVNVAKKLNIPFIAFLPMPPEVYVFDFSFKSMKKFQKLLQEAKEINVIPQKSVKNYKELKCEQYIALSKQIVQECDEFIVLWDGTFNNKLGGTSETVKLICKSKKEYTHILLSRDI